MQLALEVDQLSKTYRRSGDALRALDAVSLQVRAGEMVALLGASGSGKSTLLRHVSGLITADRGIESGTVTVMGNTVQSQGRLARDVRRTRSRVGFVFQQFNLVGRMSVLTNVLVGMLGHVPYWRGAVGRFTRAERLRALAALHRVGMADYAGQRADALSGGQQQRVAIARTLAQEAEVILADEPVASLDPESARRVLDALQSINRQDGRTVVVSLHQVDYALRYCPRTVALKAGKVCYDGPSIALTRDFLAEIYGAESGLEWMSNAMADREPPAVTKSPETRVQWVTQGAKASAVRHRQ